MTQMWKTETKMVAFFDQLAAAGADSFWCSNNDDDGCTGIYCTSTLDCPRTNQTCLTSAKGGYCTRLKCGTGNDGKLSLGKAQKGRCDAAASCDRIFTGETACVKNATASSDCRPDTDFASVTGGTTSACMPKKK